MSVMKNFSANITIGGILSPSLKSSFTSLEASLEQVGDELSSLRSKQRALNKELSDAKRAGDSIEVLEKNYNSLQNALQKSVLKQAGLTEQIRIAKSSGASVTLLQNKYDQLSLDIKETTFKQSELTEKIKASKAAKSSIEALENEYKQLGGQIDKVAGKQKSLQMKKINQDSLSSRKADARGDLFDKVGIGLALAQPIQSAIQFESVMADLNKVANYTGKEYKSAQKDILGLSRTMPMAADQIGAIYTAAAQSGQAKEDLKDFAENAIKMGVAFDISGGEAGQMMSNWRAGMGLTNIELVTMADSINAVSNNSNATAKNIAEVVTRMGAVAKTAGLANGEIVGLSAALLQAGTAPEVAGTALKNFTNNLTKGKAAPKALREAFGAIGLDAVQTAKDMQKDAEGTIFKVLEAIKKKVPKHEQSAVLSGITGEEGKSALAPLVENLEQTKGIFRQAKDVAGNAGSMNKEYETRSKTTANSIILFKNNVEALGIAVGTVLLPPINSMLTAFTSGVSIVAGLSEKYPTLTKYVVIAGTAFVGLSVGISAVRWAMLALQAGTPLGWITLAVSAVVALGIAIYDNWDKVGGIFRGVGNLFKAAFGGYIGILGTLFALTPIGWVTSMVAGIHTIISQWNPALGFFDNLWNGISLAFENGANRVVSWIKWIGSWITPLISDFKSVWNWFAKTDGKDAKFKKDIEAAKARASNDNKVAKENFQGANSNKKIDNSKTNVTINVTPHPNQSPQQIAQQVSSRIPRKTGTGGNLYDDAE